MGPLMNDFPFCRKDVILPRLLQMNQGALALAEHKVLQGRDGKQVVVGKGHGGVARLVSVVFLHNGERWNRLYSTKSVLVTGCIPPFRESEYRKEFLLLRFGGQGWTHSH